MVEPAQQVPELAYISDPLASARIPILLVPVGNISRRTWDKWSSQIRRFTELRLNDVPGTSGGPASKSDKGEFLEDLSVPHYTRDGLIYTIDSTLPASIFPPSQYPHPFVIHKRATTKRCPAIIFIAGLGVSSGCDRYFGPVGHQNQSQSEDRSIPENLAGAGRQSCKRNGVPPCKAMFRR